MLDEAIAAGMPVRRIYMDVLQSTLYEDGADMLVGLSWVAFFFIVLVMPLTFLQRSLEKRWSVAR